MGNQSARNEENEAGVHHVNHIAAQALVNANYILSEPFTVYKPKLFPDGNQWCALYGENLQDGVAGFGDSPALAVADFNRAWGAALKEQDNG